MAEPLFGSVLQWPSIPSPGFGYPPALAAPVSRPLGLPLPTVGQGSPIMGGMPSAIATANPSPSDPYAFGSGMGSAQGGPGFGAGMSAVVSSPIVGGIPPLMSPEIAIGMTAPALLATVAMRRGQPFGPTNDQEIEDFIYDALDLIPGASDVEVRCDGGRATFTGAVPHKRVKRDAGEIAWAIPALNDVQNNITIATRRRSRTPSRDNEAPAAGAARKQP